MSRCMLVGRAAVAGAVLLCGVALAAAEESPADAGAAHAAQLEEADDAPPPKETAEPASPADTKESAEPQAAAAPPKESAEPQAVAASPKKSAEPQAAAAPPPEDPAETNGASEPQPAADPPRAADPEDAPEPERAAAPEQAAEAEEAADAVTTDGEPTAESLTFELLGEKIGPGAIRHLTWAGIESFSGASTRVPVTVLNGVRAGPVLCLVAAVHGDELNGIEIVRRVLSETDPSELTGTVIGVPIVNVLGFQRASRYLPDRRDLNRYFPGNPTGSSASRMAYSFFDSIARRCRYLVDLHTGSFHRTNVTQLRADLTVESVRTMSKGFGGLPVLHSVSPIGTLRRAATDAGIAAVTVEAGEPMRLDVATVEQAVSGVGELLSHVGMIAPRRWFGGPQPVFYRSTWVRAEQGGILLARVGLGDRVVQGQTLGTVTDPITNRSIPALATVDGSVLGMAVNQFVMPGFALFRIGIKTPSEAFAEAHPYLGVEEAGVPPTLPDDGHEDEEGRPE